MKDSDTNEHISELLLLALNINFLRTTLPFALNNNLPIANSYLDSYYVNKELQGTFAMTIKIKYSTYCDIGRGA